MKYSSVRYLLPALFLILFSCKKTNEPVSQTVTLHVSEFKTNLPIEGAKFTFLDDGSFDVSCLCTDTHVLFTGLTDSKGNFSLDQDIVSKSTRGIEVDKTSYIGIGSDNKTTQFVLSAEQVIQLRLFKVNSYPGENIAILQYTREAPQTIGGNMDYHFGPETIDTTFSLLAYGEQLNTFTLLIRDSSGNTIATPGPFQIPVSRTDNTVKEIQY